MLALWWWWTALALASEALELSVGFSLVLTLPEPMEATVRGPGVIEVLDTGNPRVLHVVGRRVGTTELHLSGPRPHHYVVTVVASPKGGPERLVLETHTITVLTLPRDPAYVAVADPAVARITPLSGTDQLALIGGSPGTTDVVILFDDAPPVIYNIEVPEGAPPHGAALPRRGWATLDLPAGAGPLLIGNPDLRVRARRGQWQARFRRSGWSAVAASVPDTRAPWIRTYLSEDQPGAGTGPGLLPTAAERGALEDAAVGVFRAYLDAWRAGDAEGWAGYLHPSDRRAIDGAFEPWPDHLDVEIVGARWISGTHAVVAYQKIRAQHFTVGVSLATLARDDGAWRVVLDDAASLGTPSPERPGVMNRQHTQPGRHGLTPIAAPERRTETRARAVIDAYLEAVAARDWATAVGFVEPSALEETHAILHQTISGLPPEARARLPAGFIDGTPAELWQATRAAGPSAFPGPREILGVIETPHGGIALSRARATEGEAERWATHELARHGGGFTVVPSRMLDGFAMLGTLLEAMEP